MNCFRISSCCRAGAWTDVAPVVSEPALQQVSSSNLLDPELAMLGRPRIPLSPRQSQVVKLFRAAARAVMAGKVAAPVVSDPVLRRVSSSNLQDPELAMLGRPRIPLSPR